MSKNGLIGLAMLLAAAFAAVWMLRETPEQTWMKLKQAQLETNAGLIRDSNRTIIRRPKHRAVEAVAIGHVETDRTRLIVTLEAVGQTKSAAREALLADREALEAAFQASGLLDTELQVYEQSVVEDDTPRPRTLEPKPRDHIATLKAAITVMQQIDPLALLTEPGFDRIAELVEVRYWFSDPDEALAPVEQAALASARERATQLYGVRAGPLEAVTFTSNLKARDTLFKGPRPRVSMTAKATFELETDSATDDGEAGQPLPRGVEMTVIGDPPTVERADTDRDRRTVILPPAPTPPPE